MYVSHCSTPAAARWTKKRAAGTAAGRASARIEVSWEIMWNYDAAVLGTKDFQSALSSLQTAESQANTAKVNDYRLHRDLAIALHGTQQDADAMKHLTGPSGTRLHARPDLAGRRFKATGKPAPATPSAPATEPAKTDPPKTDVAKTDLPKIEPAKVDVPADLRKVDPPRRRSAAAKTPDPEPAKVDPPRKWIPRRSREDRSAQSDRRCAQGHRADTSAAAQCPSRKKTRAAVPQEAAASDSQRLRRGRSRQTARLPGCTGPRRAEDRRRQDQSRAVVRRSRKAMYRGAWAIKPGDEALIGAFRELLRTHRRHRAGRKTRPSSPRSGGW